MKLLQTVIFFAILMAAPAMAQAPLRVVSTIGMIGDVAAEVGGDCVSVTTLMGPGTDPHLYRASAGDVRRLNDAELILYGGLRLEGQMDDVLTRLGERRAVVAVMERVPQDVLLEDDSQPFDPHLWMDASLWAETIDIIETVIAELRPDCAASLEANAERYRSELLALHDWAQATLATVPENARVLVTAHDAFYYFGRAYGLQVEGIQGISTEAEASVADIRAVVDLIVTRGIPAIFPETTINPRNIRAVQAAVRDRGAEVAIGANLFSDAMGEAGTPEGSYIGMIRSNVITVAEALGGEAAPWPEALSAWAARWEL